MTAKNICKAVSKAFNSSSTYEEFLINLDLVEVSIDDAETTYTHENALLLKYYKQWCVDGKISFSKIFVDGLHRSVVLPYSVRSKSGCIFVKAIVENERVVQHSITTFHNEMMYSNYGIDIYNEMIVILMHELAMEDIAIKKRGISHGKV